MNELQRGCIHTPVFLYKFMTASYRGGGFFVFPVVLHKIGGKKVKLWRRFI
ncbi:hypothetical protein D3C76_267240 [compost metagenome]